ncbi:uncharacterized protein [Nicotiana tomentosiformis]|uniref:uncharacterized protein n=1 Tax=Nicotiana tomentosiformis TaxID=4098 RepID=UPI00388C72F5
METAYANINWQLWLFFDAVVEWELVEDTEQQVTVRVFHHDLGQHMMMTFVYAKCSAIEGLDLWDHLYYLASDMELPWLVGGDFNVILHEDEKIGGLPVHPPEYEDFAFYVNFIVCLSKGTKEVHSHGGMGDPMLSTTNFVKPFRFLNFWTKHATFMDVVRQNWEADFIGDPFLMFKQNIKRVKAFTNEGDASEFSLLNNVPSMVTMDHNLKLSRLPTIEEVRATVFELSGESASGPNGFSGLFYQTCWDVIGADIHNMGRSIFENILLTQEIVTNIRLRGKPANVVIELDMAKAYDRVSWKYLLHVLRNMVFSEHFINMVWNLMSNNWYSVLVNWQSSGFFKSTRGVKQGDPLSPALFILSAEAVGAITGFARGKFPFIYLGCPILYTKRRKDYYEDLIKKVKDKLHSWKGKLMSFGGKATLISSVLQSMPVHMLPVLDPQNSIMGHLHKTFARFFWSTNEEGRSIQWASWQNLCLPKEEMGLGFRSLNDVSRALFAKLWWRFRTTKYLWPNFMWNKYCKKELPTVVHFRGGSHVWRQMLNAREEVEHEIIWELKSGTTNIWHENWTGLGALYHVLPEDFPINEDLQEVAKLRQGEACDDQLLDQTFNEEIAKHIRLNVHYEGSEGYWDRPYWMPTPSGKFSVSSAWQILRHRADPN